MFKHTINSRALWQGLALACVIAGRPPLGRSPCRECPRQDQAYAREKVDLKPVASPT